MANEIKVSEFEYLVLKELAECFYDETDWSAFYMRGLVAHTKLTLAQVRRSVRALARKGLAAYERGLFDEDGQVAGSGYRATKAGKELVEARYAAEDRERELAKAQSALTL